jgi:hypothetical protein
MCHTLVNNHLKRNKRLRNHWPLTNRSFDGTLRFEIKMNRSAQRWRSVLNLGEAHSVFFSPVAVRESNFYSSVTASRFQPRPTERINGEKTETIKKHQKRVFSVRSWVLKQKHYCSSLRHPSCLYKYEWETHYPSNPSYSTTNKSSVMLHYWTRCLGVQVSKIICKSRRISRFINPINCEILSR